MMRDSGAITEMHTPCHEHASEDLEAIGTVMKAIVVLFSDTLHTVGVQQQLSDSKMTKNSCLDGVHAKIKSSFFK